MKQFEYKTEVFHVSGLACSLSGKKNKGRLTEHLNQLGRRGWELCDIQHSRFYNPSEALLTFKREKSGD